MSRKILWSKDPGTGLYAVVTDDGALIYEAGFTYREAQRQVACENHGDFTWDECRDYVEGRTSVKPWRKAKS